MAVRVVHVAHVFFGNQEASVANHSGPSPPIITGHHGAIFFSAPRQTPRQQLRMVFHQLAVSRVETMLYVVEVVRQQTVREVIIIFI